MVSICLKARCKYKKQALFLSCFGVYTDFSYFLPGLFQTFCCVLGAVFEISAVSATFCLVFSRHFAVFWVLFLRFLQFQLPFAWSFPDILLCFGCCFGDFCSFSYFFSDFPWLLGWVLGAVFRISAVSATFSRIFAGFWARFGCCFRSFRDYSFPSPSYCLCYQPMAIEHYANLVLLS